MEENFVVPGGNVYSNKIDLEEGKPMSQSINELYFGAYRNLINQIGLFSELELALHIRIHKVDRMPEYINPELICRIETIPIIQHNISYYEPKYNDGPAPYMPNNRKCTLKERLRVLFKGEL